MAEDKPSLHIDSDWKKQAQEEKKRLAEQEAKNKPPVAPMGVVGGAATAAPARAAGAGRAPRGEGEMPEAGFESLIQSIVTQVLYYLGEIGARGMEPMINLDMAKHQLDTLGMLEEKTKGNLDEEEQFFLDQALYEARMRFISVASRMAELP